MGPGSCLCPAKAAFRFRWNLLARVPCPSPSRSPEGRAPGGAGFLTVAFPGSVSAEAAGPPGRGTGLSKSSPLGAWLAGTCTGMGAEGLA